MHWKVAMASKTVSSHVAVAESRAPPLHRSRCLGETARLHVARVVAAVSKHRLCTPHTFRLLPHALCLMDPNLAAQWLNTNQLTLQQRALAPASPRTAAQPRTHPESEMLG